MAGWYGGILPIALRPKTTNIPDDIVTDLPICVTAFGVSKSKATTELITNRPSGRKDYLLTYVVTGGFFEISQNLSVKQNNVFLYKPNQPQVKRNLTDEPCNTLWIHFTGAKVEEILEKYKIEDTLFEFDTHFSYFAEAIDRMYTAKDNPYWQDICNALLTELLCYISTAKKETDLKRKDYKRLLLYMRETCTQNLPVKVYADFFGFSEVYFVRFFKKASKKTPHAYITMLRLEKACKMLLHTDLPINKIAVSVGYSTARYFSKAFYDQYGITPSEYRNRSK